MIDIMIHIKGNLMSLKSNQHIMLYLDSIKRYCKNLKSFIDYYETHKEEFNKFIESTNINVNTKFKGVE